MPKYSRVTVSLTNAPPGIQRLILAFNGAEVIRKAIETSPGAIPAQVSFELPNGLYAVVAWYDAGSRTFLADRPVPLDLPNNPVITIDLSCAHPDDLTNSNL